MNKSSNINLHTSQKNFEYITSILASLINISFINFNFVKF